MKRTSSRYVLQPTVLVPFPGLRYSARGPSPVALSPFSAAAGESCAMVWAGSLGLSVSRESHLVRMMTEALRGNPSSSSTH